MFQWDATYEIGEENIDRQHKLLFSHIDKLESALDEGNVATQLPNILNYLKIYVNLHFAYEEQCMFLHHCPVAEENKTAHEKFQEAISRFDDRVQNRDRGPDCSETPLTPPGVRVRTGRFISSQ